MGSRIVLALIGLLVFSSAMLGMRLTVPVAAAPGTIKVGLNQGYETIQDAINAASVGATVWVSSGTYHEHLTINKSITLRGAGSDSTFINGDSENITIVTVTVSNVEIRGFTIENGSKYEGWHGIHIVPSVNVTIRNNVIRKSYNGVFLSVSNSCNIINNTLADNDYGIRLSESCDNTVIGNYIMNNQIGIWLTSEGSRYNKVYHNNFINNPIQVLPLGYATIWDDNYPSGGNYWSNHNTPDIKNGPYQNETGSDGIGDIPYPDGEWPQFAFDNYPLKGPICIFNACTWAGVTYYVNIISSSNSTVSDFNFSRDDKLVSFNVTGPDDTTGFCRITIPKELLWCDTPSQWTVLVDNNPVIPTIKEDGNNAYLYFTYPYNTKKVQIMGTHVIPEFPIALLLPIFMLATLLAMVFVKRRNE